MWTGIACFYSKRDGRVRRSSAIIVAFTRDCKVRPLKESAVLHGSDTAARGHGGGCWNASGAPENGAATSPWERAHPNPDPPVSGRGMERPTIFTAWARNAGPKLLAMVTAPSARLSRPWTRSKMQLPVCFHVRQS